MYNNTETGCFQLGIFIVYLMDFCVGCGWWMMVLYLLEIGALFMVRGRPYSGETVVATLFSQANHNLQVWLAPMLSFDWNIILPVALIVSLENSDMVLTLSRDLLNRFTRPI